MERQKVMTAARVPMLRWLLHLKINKLKICLGYVHPSSDEFLRLALALSGAEISLKKLGKGANA